ncbi:hypothetical protein LQ327_13055 [Actinomycetospora endophytica]|uniref:Phytoene synthase n=1 Tax=Actinomycetospora endophytica TaxID=2291215 RepID=A0ABS8P7S2_9PSEU|nr:hypothetical protein [Actinomycetospora endophytica]MCD2194303.1 hypothetical protein [Actinomycetospora endophytica]
MPAVSDRHMISVLRPFVAATGPVLTGLRDADPFRLGRLARRRALELEAAPADAPPEPAPTTRLGRARRAVRSVRTRFLDRLATSRLPGTPRWSVMTPEERDHWWVGRVGRFTSAIASIPGIGGALARRLPVSDILGLAAQGLVVCAIAGEHGVTGRDDQVRLLGTVLFDRDLRPGEYGDPHDDRVERDARDLTGDLGTAGEPAHDGRLKALARAVWRMGRSLFALGEELERRPQGRWWWRTIANLPVVGALGAYKSERSGLKRAARRAARAVRG